MSANNEFNIIEILQFAGLSAMGGLLGYLMRQATREQPIKLGRATLEAVASGFIGVITMFLCHAIGLPWYWSGAVVGVLGWLGAEASIVVIARAIRGKIGLDLIPEKEKKDEPKDS
ncbi:hypothetical protein PHAGE_JEFFCO_3 [Acinetobacter phage JeffCo]|nr:hypothetical protein PHAGE_JEFFCO_3 [Acinetobacter phage JeffCo]